jgi:hypothetical protein
MVVSPGFCAVVVTMCVVAPIGCRPAYREEPDARFDKAIADFL